MTQDRRKVRRRSPARRNARTARAATAASAEATSPSAAPPAPRRDDSGVIWTLQQVETEIIAIVAKLTPGADPASISRSTRFGNDLGWDDWYKLRVVKPVRARLHETLADAVVKDIKKVGDLIDYVWSRMEDVS
jgi:acyl carrier protein